VNLLDRHIFRSVLFTCLGTVALFTFILTLGNVLKDLLGHTLAGQVPLTTFIRLTSLWIPSMAVYALPMGMMTGVLLTLGRLSADSEITAMRAAGVSLARIAWPVCVLGALCAALALYINFKSMPWARVQYERDLAEAVRTNPLSFIVPKTFIRDFRNRVVYVGQKEGAELREIWVLDLDPERRVHRLIRADQGRVDFDEATNNLIVTLFNTKVEERESENPEDFSKAPKIGSLERFEEIRIPIAEYLGGQGSVRIKQEWLTYDELRAEIVRQAALPPAPPEKRREAARALIKPSIVIHDKFNISLAVFSFAVIGVPLGIKVSRRETSANLGLALLLVLGYYMLTVMIKWLDRHPEYHPDLLLWLPNLLFLALGVWLFSRVDRK
jgi:lipopolysaccharide export system permease protein